MAALRRRSPAGQPGQGSRFHFTIPCVPAEGEPEPEGRLPTASR